MSTRLMIVLTALALAGCGQALRTAPTARPTTTATARAALATAAPAPTSAPIATIRPSNTPVLVAPVLAAPMAPQTGRGLGVEPAAVATPEPPAAATTYLEVVADQAPHSPRGDGQPGPSGAGSGDWAIVPTLAPEQMSVIERQVPHKVR